MKLLFTFKPSDDPQTEVDEYQLIADPEITVQVNRMGRTVYIVNEHGQDDPADAGTFWMRSHGEFCYRDGAMQKAVDVFAAKTSAATQAKQVTA